MQVNITEGGKKIQLLYVLWVLENFSDKEHTLKQDDIVAILEERGYHTERKSVARDLKLLFDFGYKIHGIEPELDEDGNELPLKRGKIWLEREFSDEQLSLLLNSVVYNVFVEKNNKEELLDNIISLGSKTFKEKHNANSLINGGRIFHVEGSTLFKQLSEIDKAIALGKKIRFTYSKLKRNGSKFVYEAEKEYTVSPYWVIVNKGNTYLVCYNHEANKIWHLRVDKMKDVKMINSYALPKTETELKGVDVGDYVTKHPLMFSGDNISVELKIAKNQIGRLVEAFGTNFYIIKETEECLTVKVTCGELDMFYWAVQYGGFVEVLSPQSLRDKIRYHIESMVFTYQRGDGDKYTEAIRAARRSRILMLQGIELTGKTKHYSLKNVRNIYLSNNNIDNIEFVKNMQNLWHACIENNNVSDISPMSELKNLERACLVNLPIKNIDALSELSIEYLNLKLDRTVDLSALAKMEKLKRLELSEKCSFNPTIPWKRLEEKNIKVVIFDREPDDEIVETQEKKALYNYYPYNFFREVFGANMRVVGKVEEMIADVDKVIDRFTGKEREYLELYYKKCIYSHNKMKKQLGVDSIEYDNVFKSARMKILHPSFNKQLEKYLVEEDDQKNYSVSETIKRKKEIQKNSKN